MAASVQIVVCKLFSSPLWVRGENRAKLKKVFNLSSRLKWRAQYSPDAQNIPIIFLSAIAVMLVICWTEDNFCFISDCRNSFNCKLKKLIIKQMIIFYRPSNARCSSGESVQINHFKHHTFVGMCYLSTWFNSQILNFC